MISIGEEAFSGCLELRSIEIPNSVTKIGKRAFYGCYKLKNIIIPDSVTSVGDSAFESCSELENVKLSMRMTRINDWVFSYCYNLNNIELPYGICTIGDYAFVGCRKLKHIELPDSVLEIGNSAFNSCVELENVKFSKGMLEINGGAFGYCKNLNNIEIPYGIISIGNQSFLYCDKLECIVIPDSVTYIDPYAFLFSPNIVIYGYSGSYAESYAKENEIPFVVLDEIGTKSGFLTHFHAWDAENQEATFDNPLLPTHVSENTDMSFLDSLEEMLGKYVWVTTDSDDENIFLGITLLDNKIGVIENVSSAQITIDGQVYRMEPGLAERAEVFASTLTEQKAKYYFSENMVFEIVLPEEKSGILKGYDSAAQEFIIADLLTGQETRYVSELQDLSVLNMITNYFNWKVTLTMYEDLVYEIEFVSIEDTSSAEYLIDIAQKYCTGEMADLMEKIFAEGGDSETIGRKLDKLFLKNGISDPLYGICYARECVDERWAYNGLISNELYCAYLYKDYLHNTVKGTAARASLAASGLVFNDETDKWMSLDTLSGETPGITQYKEMLETFICEGGLSVECLQYSKKIGLFMSRFRNNMTERDISELDALLDKGETAATNEKVKELLERYSVTTETDGTRTISLIDKDFSKALGLANDTLTLVDVTVDEILDYMELSSKLAAYNTYKDFLEEVKDEKDLPIELRAAAYFLMQEMEMGYGQPLIDALKKIGNWSLGKLEFLSADQILSWKWLSDAKISVSLVSYAIDTWGDIGGLVENSKYTEGYGFLTEYYAGKLRKDEERFRADKSEENARQFLDDYMLLYELRLNGEEAYRDMCDMDGAYYDLYKFIFNEAKYQAKIDLAEERINFLEEKCKLELKEETIYPDEVQYNKKVVISCPVDVFVYDSNENLVCTLADGAEVDISNRYGRFAVWYDLHDEEYGKSICLTSNADLKIIVKCIDTGLYTMEIADSNGEMYKLCNQKIYAGDMVQIETENPSQCMIHKNGSSETSVVDMVNDNMEYVSVDDVVFGEEQITCAVGEQIALDIQILPENASNQQLSWFSENENIAVVKNGVLEGLEEGKTEIIAVAQDGGISRSCGVIIVRKSEIDTPVIPDENDEPNESVTPTPDTPVAPITPDDSTTPSIDTPTIPSNDTNETAASSSHTSGGGGSSSSASHSNSSYKAILPPTPGYWLQDEKGWRFLNLDGMAYLDAWIYVNNLWYRLGADGYMLERWAIVNDLWYYFMPVSGEMKTGWFFDGQSWYYFNENGAMQTGWILVSGDWYYLGDDGRLLVSTMTPDGYRVDGDGKWIN